MFRIIVARRLAAAALVVAPALITLTSAMGEPPRVAPARFHLALKRAEPAVNDTVSASPKMLKLWFTESVGGTTTAVRLMNANNEAVKLGEVSVDAAPLSPAVVAVPETLAAGTYTVMWRAMADDGHPSSGKFAFTVK